MEAQLDMQDSNAQVTSSNMTNRDMFFAEEIGKSDNAKLNFPHTKITLQFMLVICAVFTVFPCPAVTYPERRRCACVAAVVHVRKSI